MSANMVAALHLVLDDKISAGLKLMQKSLSGLADAGKSIGLGKLTSGLDDLRRGAAGAAQVKSAIAGIGTQAERTGGQIRRMAQDLAFAAKYHATLGAQAAQGWLKNAANPSLGKAANQIGVIGGVAAGYSVVQPVREYAAQETILRKIAITKGLSGQAADNEIARLNKLINEDAKASGQTNHAVAEAYLDLQGQGISTDLIDKVIRQHSLAATAYGISPEVLGSAVGALIQSFKVPEDEIGATLAAMANASKQGRFKISDFATHLPGVAASFSSAGIKGKDGAIMSFAALETVMKNVGEPGQAATSLNEVLSNIFSPFAERFFAKKGLDLGGMLRAAEKQHVDPLTAVLDELDALTKGKTDVEQKQIIGALVHDETARRALIALLQHKGDYLDLQKKLGGSSQATLQGDFSTMAAGPGFQLRMLDVNSEILGQEIGKTFLPILRLLNVGLGHLVETITWLNQDMPKTTMLVGSIAGGIVLLGGALGVVSMVWPAISAGFSLMFAPIARMLIGLQGIWRVISATTEVVIAFSGLGVAGFAAVVAAIGVMVLALDDIYEHWDHFSDYFAGMWDGLKGIVSGTWSAIGSLLTPGMPGLEDALKRARDGFTELFTNIGKLIQDVAGDLIRGLLSPIDAMVQKLNGLVLNRAAPGRPEDDLGLPGVDGTVTGPIAPQQSTVHVKVSAEPGSTAEARSASPGVTVTNPTAPDPGRILHRDW